MSQEAKTVVLLALQSRLPPLPLEIIMEIVSFCPTSSLPAVCLASRTLYRFAADALYRCIAAPRNLLAACHTLSANPSLASRVRAFSMTSACVFTRVENSYSLIRDALACTTNLRLLRLDHPGPRAWVLEKCTAPIQDFRCGFDADTHLVRFLHRQRGITRLHLTSNGPNGYRLVDECLPALTSVKARGGWLTQTVPGRPVRRAGVLGDVAIDLSVLAESTAPAGVTMLELSAACICTSSLMSSQARTALSAVQVLKLRISHDPEWPSHITEDAWEALARTLSSFSHVERVALEQSRALQWDERVVVRRISAAAPQLREIVLYILHRPPPDDPNGQSRYSTHRWWVPKNFRWVDFPCLKRHDESSTHA